MIFLAHRFPFPPNKGERIRAWNLLQHFAKTWDIHFACLSDDPADAAHHDAIRPLCASFATFPINKRAQKLRALAGFRPGRPLMLDYNHHAGLAAWSRATLAANRIDLAYVFSTAMAPYILEDPNAAAIPRILDMQDVDSEKWREYAPTAGFPMRHVWAREARTLLAYERRAAAACAATLLVSAPECTRFLELAPEITGRLHAIEQGVDLAFFAPENAGPSPFPPNAPPQITMVGNMDYWPNADGATWFAREILPLLRTRSPAPEFNIVGANPGPDIQALATLPGLRVTGRVPDVRPWVAHAAVSVTPLRIARGIQNKILEAMALARPVVTTPQGYEGLRATAGSDLLVAESPAAIAATIAEILDGKHPTIGPAARTAMQSNYAWPQVFARLDAVIASTLRQSPSNTPKP